MTNTLYHIDTLDFIDLATALHYAKQHGFLAVMQITNGKRVGWRYV